MREIGFQRTYIFKIFRAPLGNTLWKTSATRLVGAKTTETLIESFLSLSTKAIGMVVRLKDTEALPNELKNDYIITKELSNLSGNLALRCGRLLAVANAFLITAKHVDFSAEEPRHPSRDSDGYPLAGLNVVPPAEQSSANAEQLVNITRQFLN